MHHDFSILDSILERYPREESSLVMVLQDVQSRFQYLPCEVLERVAEELSIPRGRVFSAATFYKAFSLEPQGRTLIQVCKGTACHVRGAQLIEDELCRRLEVPVGGTTGDRQFTIKTVNCVGACALAPLVITGETYHAGVKPSQVARMLKKADRAPVLQSAAALSAEPLPMARLGSPAELRQAAQEAATLQGALQGCVRICGGTGCLAAGSQGVMEALRQAGAAAGLNLKAELSLCQHPQDEDLLTITGCQRRCQEGPLVHVMPGDVLYSRVQAGDAEDIVEALAQGGVVEKLLGESRTRAEHPFYKGQHLAALSVCGHVDPGSFLEYLAVGGFTALADALQVMTPEDVLQSVEASGLRGRGGAGFSTGRKWRSALRASAAAQKKPFVLCNGDEGDPGAFMDRVIMEGAPFQIVEGMILGAFALGGRHGYIYVRNEYPLAVERLEGAISACRDAGLLGEEILGSDLCFDIRISRGGGAFVCGESTALMRSIEGKVGEPRAKYVRSVERGLYDSPTVLNNVETWALVPGIISGGAEVFAALGTARSSGTKAFSLSGQIRRTGLVEVPMGTSLRKLIFDIGGGVPEGRIFKAVQTGGPSGGCLPEAMLDLPIDFDALTEAGSMMGSGGMIVMDDRTCMVDVAQYFMNFLQEESCGKCPPCRLGLQQISALLGRVIRGEADQQDLETIEEVAQGIAESSLCGLGKTAANPVLSTLRYFRDEYEAHLQGRCPAGVCRALIRYEITEACTGCLLCIKPCPEHAISGAKGEVHAIDQDRCTRCGICLSVCDKYKAVEITSGGNS